MSYAFRKPALPIMCTALSRKDEIALWAFVKIVTMRQNWGHPSQLTFSLVHHSSYPLYAQITPQSNASNLDTSKGTRANHYFSFLILASPLLKSCNRQTPVVVGFLLNCPQLINIGRWIGLMVFSHPFCL